MTPFTDLACSRFLTIPTNLDSSSLVEFIERQEFENKTKIIFDNYDSKFVEQNVLSSNQNLIVKPYNSNFFIFDRGHAQDFLNNELLADFNITEINFEDKENIGIVKNLLKSSFAVKISKDENGKTIFEERREKAEEILANFDLSFTRDGLKTFLVKSKLGEIVGCYSLIKVGEEVQLSGVAGRTTLPNSYQGKKLIILCQAMVSSFLNTKDFDNSTFLTLSNSKEPVAKMYADLGIPKNITRKGLLVQPN